MDNINIMDSNFKLEGKLVRLRPLEEKDIKNLTYYMIDDIEWQDWDAPWELVDNEIFNQVEYEQDLKMKVKSLKDKGT